MRRSKKWMAALGAAALVMSAMSVVQEPHQPRLPEVLRKQKVHRKAKRLRQGKRQLPRKKQKMSMTMERLTILKKLQWTPTSW